MMEEETVGPFSTRHFCLLCNISLEPEPEEPEPVLVDLVPSDEDDEPEVHEADVETRAKEKKIEDTKKPRTIMTISPSGEIKIHTEEDKTQVVENDCEDGDVSGIKNDTPTPMECEDSKTEAGQAEPESNLVEKQIEKTKVDKIEVKEPPTQTEAAAASIPHPSAVIAYTDEDHKTLSKYHEFLKTVLHIDILSGHSRPSESNSLGGQQPGLMEKCYDEFPFCVKCKDRITNLYDLHTRMRKYTKLFGKSRDGIARGMVKTFLEQNILNSKTESTMPKTLTVQRSEVSDLTRKWKNVYTGEAEIQNKIETLRKQFEERVEKIKAQPAPAPIPRPRVEFPEGTGLSHQELLKMQRMMTACYFTPKMSIVRKKDKLFFRVGIPKGDQETILYSCKTCNMNFVRERTLNIHLRTHRLKKQTVKLNQCKACGEICQNLETLITHRRSHVNLVKKTKKPVEKFQCDLCDKGLISKSALSVHHMKAHELTEPRQCTTCNDSFTTEYHYTKHSLRHTDTPDIVKHEIFYCEKCSKAFLKPETFNEHLRVHSDSGFLECVYCGLPFETIELLEEHGLVHEDGNPFNCEGCSGSFPTEALMMTHLKQHHRPKPFPCVYCSKCFRTSDGLRKHEAIHFEDEGEKKPYVCEPCDECFVDRKSFLAHSVKHAGKPPYQCSLCQHETIFKGSKDLRKHKLEAHFEHIPEELKFHCEICWHSFATSELLDYHSGKAHLKHKCDVCHKIFKLADHLRRHSFIHTGEKPYKCEHCPKSFNQESNLKEHMYRHTGIRPHQCPYCPGVGFLRRVQLKEHMEREHQISDVPTLPMGRASQNARKAGTHPVQNPRLLEPVVCFSDEPARSNAVINSISLTQPEPIVVNNITLDGTSGRLAPIIMKNLQNRSTTQSMIVRRGIQPNETKEVPMISVKSETPGEYQVSEAMDLDQQQQYVIYL